MDLFGFESVDTLPFLAVSVLLLRILSQSPPSLKPILTFPKGRNRLLQLIVFSPHLASPEGEGRIPLVT